MVVKRVFTLVACLAVLSFISNPANSDPQSEAAPAETDLQKAKALQEIHNIRRKLGGSVLRGSILDEPNQQADVPFDKGLRDRLGLPVPNAQPKQAKQTPAQIVTSLRTHSTELDRIANEIEVLRAYKNADSLRATAKTLRTLARQFDTGGAQPNTLPFQSLKPASSEDVGKR